MSENTLASDVTDTSLNNQANEKTYTQKEVDDMMARTKSAIQKKVASKYDDLGDPEELRQLKADYEQRKLEEQKKRGEFDSIIANLAAKKDEEIRKRDDIIRNYTVDLPLVNAAAQYGSVNPSQVKALLKSNVRIGESGEVEVLDEKGTVRYSDKGQPFRVEDLVKEFLDTNPHFKAAGPSTTQAKSNVSQSREKLDITKLDMKNPADRKLYAEYRKTAGIA
jgi:formate-dependent nitrite reductase cytochrome c552 subunit